MSKTGIELPENTPDAVRQEAETIEGRIKDFQDLRKTRQSGNTRTDPGQGADQRPAELVPASDSTPNPTATTQQTPADDAARLAAENQELRQRTAELKRQVDVANGKFGGTIQGLKATIVDLQQQLADRRVAPLQEPPPNEKPWLTGIKPEDVEKYGEEFFETVWRSNRAELAQLRADLKQITAQSSERIQAMEEKVRSERFAASVEILCPGALQINGGAEGTGPLAVGWPEFLDSPVTVGGVITNRQEADAAVAAGNAPAYAALVNRFKGAIGTPNTSARQAPSVRAQVQPLSIVGRSEPPQGKRKIPESEIREWTEAMGKAPPGTISAAEVDRKMREFADARREGRVIRG